MSQKKEEKCRCLNHFDLAARELLKCPGHSLNFPVVGEFLGRRHRVRANYVELCSMFLASWEIQRCEIAPIFSKDSRDKTIGAVTPPWLLP